MQDEREFPLGPSSGHSSSSDDDDADWEILDMDEEFDLETSAAKKVSGTTWASVVRRKA